MEQPQELKKQDGSFEKRKLSITEEKVIDYIMSSQEYILTYFFGLRHGGESVSAEENDAINLYFYDAGLRVAKAYSESRFEKFEKFNSETGVSFVNKDDEFKAFVDDYLVRLFCHDVSHHSEKVINDQKILVPSPLTAEATAKDVDRDSIKEELYAALWMKQSGYEFPNSLAIFESDFEERLKAEVKRSKELSYIFPDLPSYILNNLPKAKVDFDTYVKVYAVFVLNIKVLPGVVRKFFESRLEYDKNDQVIKESLDKAKVEFDLFFPKLADLSNDIETDLDPKLIDLLKYVFDNRNNPRVLVDLFFREVGPRIKTLKKEQNQYLTK